MHIVAVIQQKGGVGKTTLSTCLSAQAEISGTRTLVVDLDPQGSSRQWSQVRGAGRAPIVVDVLPEKLSAVIDAGRALGVERILVDEPSRLDNLIAAAEQVADMVILPANPGLLSLAPPAATLELISSAGKRGVAVGVINNVDPGAAGDAKAADTRAILADKFGIIVAPTVVQHLPQFSTAFDAGLGVSELKPRGRAAEQIEQLWLDLEKIAKRILAPPAVEAPKRSRRKAS